MGAFLSMLYGLVVYAFFVAILLYAIGFVGSIAVPKAMSAGARSGAGGRALWHRR